MKPKFPQPKDELLTLPDNRFYFIDGVYYPRITWILSVGYPKGEGFARFLGNAESFEAAEKIKNDAGERGTKVHKACAELVAGGSCSYADFSDTEWGMIMSFVAWTNEHKPKFLASEQLVVSKFHGYAGTFDLLVEIENQKYLVDLKTSSGIWNSFWCQTAAYAQAYCGGREEPEELRTAILRLGTKHKRGFEWCIEKKPWRESFEDFLAVKRIFHNENPALMPAIKIIPQLLTLNV